MGYRIFCEGELTVDRVLPRRTLSFMSSWMRGLSYEKREQYKMPSSYLTWGWDIGDGEITRLILPWDNQGHSSTVFEELEWLIKNRFPKRAIVSGEIECRGSDGQRYLVRVENNNLVKHYGVVVYPSAKEEESALRQKVGQGEMVTINVPFLYEIGEEGPVTGNILTSVADCIEEVRAELNSGNITGDNAFIEPDKFPTWVHNIDWGMLFTQKMSLIDSKEDHSGIIHLLDTLMDWANDDLGIDAYPQEPSQ